MKADPNLEILLLGPPEIRAGGKTVEIKRRLLRTLLYYLSCQTAPVGRGQLILLFWPDVDEETARRNMREALSKLRAQLPDPDLIIARNDRVSLDWERVYSDVREFQGYLAQIGRVLRVKSSAPFPESILQTMLKAARLWRGQRFFAGGRLPESREYDQWFDEFSQELERSRQHLLERLSDHFINLGDNETAVGWLRKAVESEPLNQELHYQLLDCLSVIGQRSEALAYCGYLQALFEREQVEPSFLIRKLCEKLHAEADRPVPSRRPPWGVSLSLQVPFVGREGELERLRHLYQRGGCALLRAEPGGGKSRLAHELYQLLEPPPRALVAICRPMESGMPYQALVDMLRQFVQPEEWQRLDSALCAPLFGLLPELARLHPEEEIKPPEGLQATRTSLYEALHKTLEQVFADQRLYWVFDDAQWSDEPSLGFLIYLLERNFFGGRGLLLIASRFEQASDHLRAFLREPHFRDILTQIDLPALNEGEVTQIARYVLGSEPPEGLGAALLRAVSGNPLFVLESLRAMLDGAGPLDTVQLPISVSLQKIYREKQRLLDKDSLALLHTAAVLGDPLRPDILEVVSGLNAQQTTNALEELEKAGILHPAREENLGASYTFTHEKIREVVLRDLSAARRRLLHLRTAGALEARSGQGNPALTSVVAGHYEAAGELLTAYRYWVKAGMYARSLYSLSEASQAFERAEALLLHIEYQLTDEDIYRLYTPWAVLLYDHALLPQAYNLYLRLSQNGLKRNSPLLLGAGLSGTAYIRGDQGEFEHGLANINNAITYLENAGNPVELIDAYNRRIVLLMRTMQYGQALEASESLLQRMRGVTDEEALAALMHTRIEMALLRLYSGYPAEAVRLGEETLTVLQGMMRMNSSVWARVSLSLAFFYIGQYKQALAHATVGYQAGLTMKNWWLVAWFSMVRGRANLAMGRIDESWKALDEALRTCEEHAIHELLVEIQCVLGEFYRLLDMQDAAVLVYQAAVESKYPGKAMLDAKYRLGSLLVRRGEVERGMLMVQETITEARKAGLGLIEISAETALGLLHFSQGKEEQSLNLLEKCAAEGARRGMATLPVSQVLVQSQMAARSGDLESVRGLAEQLLSTARRLPNPWIGVWTYQLLSPALRQSMDPPQLISGVKEFLGPLDNGCQDLTLRPYWEALQTSIYQQLI